MPQRLAETGTRFGIGIVQRNRPAG